MTERALPAAVDAERLVLGCLIRSDEVIHDARGTLSPEDFTTEQHKLILAEIFEHYDAGRKVDYFTVGTSLSEKKLLEKAGGLGYLIDLDNGLPKIQNFDSYIRILQDKTVARKVIASSTKLIELAYTEQAPAVIEAARSFAVDLGPADRKGFSSIADVVASKGVNQILAPRRDSGIKFPWPMLNYLTGGLHREQLFLIAAHTSCGKTSAALQIAEHAAQNGVGVAVFSLEMSNESIIRRLTHQRARVSSDPGTDPNAEDRAKLATSLRELNELPVYFDDSTAVTVPAIHAALRKLRLRQEVGLVVVDYLQLVRSSDRSENRNQQVGANARALKLCAKEFGIPFIVISQLNRNSEKEGRKPRLADLRDSGEIEEHTDAVMFIHPEQGGDRTFGPVRFLVAKQREGPRDEAVKMLFFKGYQRFEEEA